MKTYSDIANEYDATISTVRSNVSKVIRVIQHPKWGVSKDLIKRIQEKNYSKKYFCSIKEELWEAAEQVQIKIKAEIQDG